MSCYVVGQLKISDVETYRQYMAGFLKMFKGFDGKVLAVDDAPTVVEGDWDFTRLAIIEFASKAEAERWYGSDAYQQISRDFRWVSSSGPLLIAEAWNSKI
jgi:uncharacterized protein (DUF1330 family)